MFDNLYYNFTEQQEILMMDYTRWYDQDDRIRFILDTLESLEEAIRYEAAEDLMQIIINNKYPPELDEFLNQLNSSYVANRRRWYDRDERVHSAVEMLKYINEGEKRELLREYLYSMISQGVKDGNNLKSNYELPISVDEKF
jgi:hypothetical protein